MKYSVGISFLIVLCCSYSYSAQLPPERSVENLEEIGKVGKISPTIEKAQERFVLKKRYKVAIAVAALTTVSIVVSIIAFKVFMNRHIKWLQELPDPLQDMMGYRISDPYHIKLAQVASLGYFYQGLGISLFLNRWFPRLHAALKAPFSDPHLNQAFSRGTCGACWNVLCKQNAIFDPQGWKGLKCSLGKVVQEWKNDFYWGLSEQRKLDYMQGRIIDIPSLENEEEG